MVEAMYEEFIRFMDSLFFEGYAEQLSRENPEAFNREWSEYIDQYLREGAE